MRLTSILLTLLCLSIISCGSKRDSIDRSTQQMTNAIPAILAVMQGADLMIALPSAINSLNSALYQLDATLDPVSGTVTDEQGKVIIPAASTAEFLANTEQAAQTAGASAEEAKEAKDSEGGGLMAWGIGILGILTSMKVLSNVPVVGSLLEKGAEWFVATKSTKESRQKSDKAVAILNQVVRGVETVHDSLPESGGLGKLKSHLDKITDSDFNTIVQEITMKMAEEKVQRGQEVL